VLLQLLDQYMLGTLHEFRSERHRDRLRLERLDEMALLDGMDLFRP
jgi:hypothetical protein